MNSRTIVERTIRFSNPTRFPVDFRGVGGTDFARVAPKPNPDARPSSGVDEWGTVWTNVGVSRCGEVTRPALSDWADFNRLIVPDVNRPDRWRHICAVRDRFHDRFLIGTGVSLYERVHFLRGLDNTWIDIIEAPSRLQQLIDILVRMNLAIIDHYARAGVDGLFLYDDWGLQDKLMIAPAMWRQIWKPAYKRVFEAAHGAGLLTFLHSCGYIVEILDDLIDAGLDVIQMDQQQNMGLDTLHRFAGRITFWCPADIQNILRYGSPNEIEDYCHDLVTKLGTPAGGFMAQEYGDPVGAGHSDSARAAMRKAFLQLTREWPNLWI